MSKITIVGGNIIERIGGKDLSFARGEIINIGSSVIQTGKEKGVSYGIPRFTPLIQQIKLIVNFRPKKDWKGEFGFDWMRMGDTKLFNDYAFEKIVAYQYKDEYYKVKETNSNAYLGHFKTDEDMCRKLKKEYTPYTIPWQKKKDKMVEYFVPWLTIQKNKEAKITFFAEIEEEADYLEFDENQYFEFTPKKIDIKGRKKIRLNDFEVNIKCIEEFSTDQAVTLKAYKNTPENALNSIAGKINVWANDKSKQKKKDVVFVEVITKTPNAIKLNQPDASEEKARINQYLGQAYIQLSDTSDIVELDLSNDKNFLSFVTNGEIDPNKKSGGKELEDYLKSKLEAAYPKKYAQHFKAFYFAEHGYHPNGGNLSGYSSHGADYVVVFKSRNNQTAAHEFLHSMNLAHTFTNKEASAHALYTYEYAKTDNLMDYSHHGGNDHKRCSLFYWQWKIANSSIQ
ncbi:hypothetical protein [Bergeyella zoohelcum]|uniref:Uncharacterized protein n=1 Tax=Bergeyella zoohelcum TaxID=1015 RepID=A0A376C0R6_9FLAO|nr:hypothetical protein [Bergeyella zoohelcum]SSZ55690.1 Uncharacterised protein [Bergeyella zoohelcum]